MTTPNATPLSGEPKDLAVVLGVARPPLPRPEPLSQLLAAPPESPPELVEGFLHQGSRMILAGTSKSNKSWCLMDLAASVAAGQPWWGFPCLPGRVCYLNFELPKWAVYRRMCALYAARPECAAGATQLDFWNLRGYAADIALLRPKLTSYLGMEGYALIIIDPVYKLLGDRDENSNTEVAQLLNELEQLQMSTEASVGLAHHFAKGSPSAKTPMDRMSGAGAWGRDPDALLVLTPHEEEGCFVVSPVVRHFPAGSEFVVEWSYPCMRRAPHLDPGNLRTANGEKKRLTDHEFLMRFVTQAPQARMRILEATAEAGIGRSTTDRYLSRLRASGALVANAGLYWRPAVPAPELQQQEANHE